MCYIMVCKGIDSDVVCCFSQTYRWVITVGCQKTACGPYRKLTVGFVRSSLSSYFLVSRLLSCNSFTCLLFTDFLLAFVFVPPHEHSFLNILLMNDLYPSTVHIQETVFLFLSALHESACDFLLSSSCAAPPPPPIYLPPNFQWYSPPRRACL